MFAEPSVKTESKAPTTDSPRAHPPPAPPPAGSSSPHPLVWPAGSGLVFYWDPRTQLARRTCQGLVKYTRGGLVSTPWIDEATHVLIDVNRPLSSKERDLYEGKLVLSLEWVRDSTLDGGPKDVNDEDYQVVWEQHTEEGGAVAIDAEAEAVTKGEGKKTAREEVRRASEEKEAQDTDPSSGDDRPLHRKPARAARSGGRWTSEENLDYARYLVAYPNPNWGRYHDSHPNRSLNAIAQHSYHAKELIDPLVRKIKKEANGRPVVYVHPISNSTTSSSSRPSPPPPRPSTDSHDDESDQSSENDAHNITQPSSSDGHSHAADAKAPLFLSSTSGRPCVNCKCNTSTKWHRLKEFDTGDQQFCAACRASFYNGSKKGGFQEGKQALARRREKMLGPDASDFDSSGNDDEDEGDQPRRINTSSSSNHATSSRHSLPNTSSSSHDHQPSSSSHHRSSLPGPSTSSYLAPSSHKRALSSNEDVDPRLEKRRRNLAKMGASSASSSYASTSYHNHNVPSSNTNCSHRLLSPSPSQSNSPAPPPSNPFLVVGAKPSGCTTNRWCWVCGSDSSSRYSKINFREEGREGVVTVNRVVCGECSAWRKERRKEEMSEVELVDLTREFRRRGEEIRRGRGLSEGCE